MKKLVVCVAVLTVCSMSFKANPEIKGTHKVALTIDTVTEDANITMNLMNIYVRDFLDEIDDIEIVNAKTGDWEYLLRIMVMKPLPDHSVISFDIFVRETILPFIIETLGSRLTLKDIYPDGAIVLYPNTNQLMMIPDTELKLVANATVSILNLGYIQKDRDRLKTLPKNEEEMLEYLEKLGTGTRSQ